MPRSNASLNSSLLSPLELLNCCCDILHAIVSVFVCLHELLFVAIHIWQAPPKAEPRTIENTREFDETIVKAEDDEVAQDEATDEFSAYFNDQRVPKILFTTSQKPTSVSYSFEFCCFCFLPL